MKRTWIGAVLLAVLLALSLTVGTVMEKRLERGTEAVARAGELARAGDWKNAQALTDQARQDWEDMGFLTCALFDHGVIDQIEASFAQLPPYAAAGEGTAYHALCASLSEQLEAAGMTHGCSLRNFF